MRRASPTRHSPRARFRQDWSAKDGCFQEAADAARKEDKAKYTRGTEKQAKITDKAKKKVGGLDAKIEAAQTAPSHPRSS